MSDQMLSAGAHARRTFLVRWIAGTTAAIGRHRVASTVFVVSGFALVAAMGSAFTVHGQGRATAPTAKSIKNPVKPTAASITAGAAAYKKFCAYCHGAEGKGDGPLAPEGSNPPDLTDAEWVHGSSDGEIFTVIANGVAD